VTEAPPPTGGDEERVAAFFDLDKTIIAKAAMAAFRGPLYAGGLLNRRGLLRALLAEVVYLHLGASERRLSKMRELVLALTKGWSRDKVLEVVDEALERIIEPIIYAEAMDLIDEHHELGHLVVIVSASPEEIVVPLAHHLGVSKTISSRAELDERGRYTGEMAFYAYGPYKADALRAYAAEHGVTLSASFAYSDSYTDVPMLEAVGHPVAVNPDRVLARLARERGWELRHFVRPVRLRDRMRGRVPPSPTLAISLGALVIGVAALAAGWWLGSRHQGLFG
jgi:HAD superfamily hydrolase (TIGR01490 family)